MNFTVNRCKARCNLIINAIDVFFFFVIVSDRHLSWPHPLFWEGKIVGVINYLHPIISMYFLYTIDKRELIEWSRTFQVVDQLLYFHALRVWIRGDLWGEISCQVTMLSVKRQIVLRLGQHCCTQRVAHVWSPCSNMLLQGVATFCSFITSYNAIQHYCKMLKCCVHLAAPLRAGFILTCHDLRTFHATGVFSSLTFESHITGYRYKCSLWIGVFVVKSYHELLLSIMEFDKLIN